MSKNDYSSVKQYTAPKPLSNNQTLAQMLTKNLTAIKSALPKHLTAERICRVAINFISKSPQLQRCTPASLCGAIMEASALGLEIDMRGHAYLVPYGNIAQLQIGYKGLVELALRSGKVKQIYGDCIYEGDEYEIEMGLEPKLVHRLSLSDRGEIIASYAVAVMADGIKQFAVVPRAEIDKVKNASKSGTAWKDWFSQMALKVAVKRLCKLLPISAEVQKAVALDDVAEAEIAQTFDYDVEIMPQPEAKTEGEGMPAEEAKAETAEAEESKNGQSDSGGLI